MTSRRPQPVPWSLALIATSVALTLPAAASAAPTASAEVGVSTQGKKADKKAGKKSDKKADKKSDKKADKGARPIEDDDAPTPWIKRYRPERNMVELGVFGGALIVSDDHDFFDPKTAPQKLLWRIGPDVGARVAFFPLRVLGFEAEFAAMPTRARTDNNESVLLYGLRGHAILQLPYRFTPFLLGGYGMMGVSSDPAVVGKDIDPMGHWGGGLKLYANKWLAFRVEARHLIGAYQGRQRGATAGPAFTSHLELLAGISLTLGRPKPPPPLKDSDGDRVLDADDKCPFQPAPTADGCPVGDRDADAILDDIDACPDEIGILPDGCPIRDSDGDSFMDPDDACPDEAGIAPDGCPIRDRDGDGILDADDKCPDDPETVNGYQDADGCPDELPQQVKDFTGVIEGIFFEFNSDKIRKNSEKTLTRAYDVLAEFKDVRVEISGHTDDVGTREANLDLSARRAESVRQWLITKGIDPSRITTRGAGPDEPIESNEKAAGRAKNRRIEFKVLLK
jgi:outer membrane protein OmpA-like peptidoglycan-associated protein